MNTVLSAALIGASSAIIVNLATSYYQTFKENRKEKVEIISAMLSNLNTTLKLTKATIAYQLWYMYYNELFNLEFTNIMIGVKPFVDQNRFEVETKFKLAEKSVSKTDLVAKQLLELNHELSSLIARYLRHYSQDRSTLETVELINKFEILENLSFSKSRVWLDKEKWESAAGNDLINSEATLLYEQLNISFVSHVEKLVCRLKKKIKALG